MFRSSVVELDLLGRRILIMLVSITLVRRDAPKREFP
jgi:hypothetical protein